MNLLYFKESSSDNQQIYMTHLCRDTFRDFEMIFVLLNEAIYFYVTRINRPLFFYVY